ncbi:hypothetical protein CLOM_g13651 [Closterium sp. NIES-68]|nr:hypothetical protein CLOM_g13651 [Closterium sp. NIES-68]GJP85930.1 hypothetical protein CLOP_g16021 [Closterium sp. NIES-67]
MANTRFLSALMTILAVSCLADARNLQVINPAVPAVEPQTVETTTVPGTTAPAGLATIAAVPTPKASTPAPTAAAPTPKGKVPAAQAAPGGKPQGAGGAGAIRGAPKAHPAPIPAGFGEYKGKVLGRQVTQVGTVLRGSSVVGATPGDAEATGNAILTVYKNGPQVNIKYVVSVRRLSVAGPPTAASINKAASNAVGPAVISFAGAEWVDTTGVDRTKAGASAPAGNYISYATTGVWEDVAKIRTVSGEPLSTAFAKVMTAPESFYVTVSTPSFPTGAARGQLRKGTGATVLPPGHQRQWEEKQKAAKKPAN